jgi:hypothetical protein
MYWDSKMLVNWLRQIFYGVEHITLIILFLIQIWTGWMKYSKSCLNGTFLGPVFVFRIRITSSTNLCHFVFDRYNVNLYLPETYIYIYLCRIHVNLWIYNYK